MLIYAFVGMVLLLQGGWTAISSASASDADAGVRFAGGVMSVAVVGVGVWFVSQAWRRLRDARRVGGES